MFLSPTSKFRKFPTSILSDSSVDGVDVWSGDGEFESNKINSAGAVLLTVSWVVLSSISITMGSAAEPEASCDLSTASIKYLWP